MTRPDNLPTSLHQSLARELAAAHRDTGMTLGAGTFADLDMEDATWIQQETMSLLGEHAPISKVAINQKGEGVAAPIFASLATPHGGSLPLPKRGALGIEVEIAVRLAKPISPEMATAGPTAVLSAIESFHIGIEVIASRFDDRFRAGPYGQLADNLNTAGYIWTDVPWPRGTDINNIQIEVEVDGHRFWDGPGASPFGGILEPIVAFGRNERNSYAALDGGMLVTTGTLCGLVEITRPARIRAGIAGASPVEFELSEPAQ